MNHALLSDTIRETLHQGVRENVFPGAVALVGYQQGDILAHEAAGALTPGGAPMEKDTLFDLASVTKACATSLLAMRAYAQGRLDVDAPVARYLPSFGREEVRVWHLLAHVSGLPWWFPFFERYAAGGPGVPGVGTQEARQDTILRASRVSSEAPPGAKCVYSDLNFILLGGILEQVFMLPLEEAFAREVARPLGSGAHYRPWLGKSYPPAAPTEYCPMRKTVVQGVVHDENAWAMGGVAGHAGLFGTALDLFAIACALREEGNFLPREVLRRFWSREPSWPGTFVLGWDTPSQAGSSAGRRFSPRSVGHLGFTGTSIWIDRERQLVAILLTNRVHFGRANNAIREFRQNFHDRVGEALDWPIVRG